MRVDHLQVDVKELDVGADTDHDVGFFSGYASTWDLDYGGDTILKGAWAETLANDYPNGGAGIPIHWQHKDGSPFDIIGETLSAVEDDKGLLITAKLDLDNEQGAKAYDLLKRGLIHQMSVGFVAEKSRVYWDEESGRSLREIQQAKLFEISVVQIAMNQGAEILEVKNAKTAEKTAVNDQKSNDAQDLEARNVKKSRYENVVNELLGLLAVKK